MSLRATPLIGLFVALAIPLAISLARAEEAAKPTDVTIGSVTLQIVETVSGEKELRHGARVLVKEYAIHEHQAAKFNDTYARVFNVGPGGNACEGWPAIVTVDKGGKVSIDTTLKDGCYYFIVATEEEGFVFVQRPVAGSEGSVWRFTPDAGMSRLGLLVFQPQPKSTWKDLDKWLDHPMSLFNVAPFHAAARKLTGPQFGEFAFRLHVGSGVEKKDGRFLIGTGCQAHACNSDQGFIGIDRKGNDVYLAMKRDARVTTWPAAARWPKPLQAELESWSKN